MDDDLRSRMTTPSMRRNTVLDLEMQRPVPKYKKINSVNTNGVVSQQDKRGAPTGTASSSAAEHVKYSKASKKLRTKHKLTLGLSVVIITLIALGLYIFIFSNKSVADKNGPTLVQNLSRPNFTPFVPQGEAQLAQQNSSTSFNKMHDSYTFDDLYLGVPIQVSEQPMPSNNSSSLTSEGVMNGLIKKYGANTAINYQGGTAYVANVNTSHKQLIMFNKKGILVFIQSSMNVQADAWVAYIDNLYQP